MKIITQSINHARKQKLCIQKYGIGCCPSIFYEWTMTPIQHPTASHSIQLWTWGNLACNPKTPEWPMSIIWISNQWKRDAIQQALRCVAWSGVALRSVAYRQLTHAAVTCYENFDADINGAPQLFSKDLLKSFTSRLLFFRRFFVRSFSHNFISNDFMLVSINA